MKQTRKKISLFALLLLIVFGVPPAAAAADAVIPIGHTVGIHMHADGVLVVRLSDVRTAAGTVCPAKDGGMQEGDLIVQVDGETVHSNDALQKQVSRAKGQPVSVTVQRDGAAQTLTVTPCADENGVYRIGVLARDAMAGIGTLTYVDPETGAYGSLGHGICESETGVLLPLKDGALLYSVVSTVQRGVAGEPGALQGEFSADTVGTVTENTESGIFGTLTDKSLYQNGKAMPVASIDEVERGPATILANVAGDAVREYAVEIVKIYPADDEYGRGMMLRVTDEALIQQTGGIVQGMSGSPVLQNGKIVGAVTHVLVSEPYSGYAIGIEKMLEEMNN